MKKHILLIGIALATLGCSNNDESQSPTLSGNYIWLESSGGVDGRTETPATTGNTKEIIISNGSIKQYLNSALVSEQSFVIETMESEFFGGEREMIIYENGFKQSILWDGNQLILEDECNDCYLNKYKKE